MLKYSWQPPLFVFEWFVTMANGHDAVTRHHQVCIHHVRQAPDNDVANFRDKVAATFPVKEADRSAVHALQAAAVLA
jgi:hypothetical protein